MKRLRPSPWLFALLIGLPLVAEATIQQQRDLFAVTIVVNVTPAPLSMAAPRSGSDGGGQGIIARLGLSGAARARASVADAQNLAVLSGSLIAQTAAQQKAVKVEAEVSPNPNATTLYGKNCQGGAPQAGPCNDWTTSQTAGTTQTYACAYQVTVQTTISSWSLRHGLYNDFASDFLGGDLANNTYLTAPNPTATPFVVYLDDGKVWHALTSNGGTKTYCVDLTLTIPADVPGGTYVTSAVYTLYY